MKTGGLGDVSAALPAALREIGCDARILLPGYPQVLAADPSAREVARTTVLGRAVRLLESKLPNGVPLIVIHRQLGHTNLGITSIYLQGIDSAEIIDTVHARRAPMVPVDSTLRP